MEKDPFDDLEVKPGAQWFTGNWANRLIVALRRDRIVPAMNGGLKQLPSPKGRLLYTDAAAGPSGGATMVFRVSVDGTATDVDIPAEIAP